MSVAVCGVVPVACVHSAGIVCLARKRGAIAVSLSEQNILSHRGEMNRSDLVIQIILHLYRAD